MTRQNIGSLASRVAEIFSALSHRDFRWSQVGYMLSLLGGTVQSMSLSWWIADYTDSAFILSWLKAMLLIPTILLSLPAGIMADHFNRRVLLIVFQWAGTLQALVLCGAAAMELLTVRLALTMELLGGVLFAFEYPLQTVFQSDLAPGKDMGSARAISRGLEYTMAALGQALAGYILFWFAPYGFALCFMLNAISFGAAILALHAIKNSVGQKRGPTASRSTLALLSTIHKSPRLVELFIHKIILVSVGMYAMPLLPAFVKDDLHGTSKSAGLILAALAAGKMFGSLGVGWVKETGSALPWARRSLLLVAIAQACFAYCRTVPTAMFIIFVFALFGHFIGNAGTTMIQKEGEETDRGRLIGLLMTITLPAELIATLTTGWLSDQVGLKTIFAAAAALNIAAAITVNLYFRDRRSI